jgi:hypothetical protein
MRYGVGDACIRRTDFAFRIKTPSQDETVETRLLRSLSSERPGVCGYG